MKKTKSKVVEVKDANNNDVIVANGRIWTKEQREHYIKYQQEYHTKKYRRFSFRILNTNEEMISWLIGQPNLNEYLRDLVEADMKKKKGE